MSKYKILVIGCGGVLKQIYSHIYKEIINQNIVFYDDINLNINELYGCKIIHNFKDLDKDIGSFIIALSGPNNRHNFTQQCLYLGLNPINLIAEDVNIPNSCEIGLGNIILRQCIIEENIKIGNGNLINVGCFLHHDVEIKDFNELAPRVTLLGKSKVGEGTFIGANSCIRDKIKIGNFAKIGIGSNVIKDIPDRVLAYGNPCKIIELL